MGVEKKYSHHQEHQLKFFHGFHDLPSLEFHLQFPMDTQKSLALSCQSFRPTAAPRARMKQANDFGSGMGVPPGPEVNV
jgi:hypothetical protein